MNYNRAVMKLEVKQAMRQTRPHPMLVTLLYLVIVGIGTYLISWLVNLLFPGYNAMLSELIENIQYYGEDYFEYVIEAHPEIFLQLMTRMMIQAGTVSVLVSILTSAWSGLMNVGYAGYCLDMSRGANPQLERIFSGFPRAGSVILAYILVAVFTVLWSLLFGIGFGVLMGIAFVVVAMNDSLAILGVLLIFAASILYAVALIWVEYRYVMVPFAIVDSRNPMSAMDAIRASKTVMKGRKGSFFVLRISFIGWYLLQALVILVGTIIVSVSIAGSIGSMYYGNSAAAGLGWIAAILPVVLICGAANFIINLWLTPYRTGCDARFYLYAAGGAQPTPYQPGPYCGQPPYGGQSGPYGGQSGPYVSQPGPYGGQPGPYGGQSGPYGGQSGPYGSQPGPYGSQPGPYGSQPGPYGSQPGPYNNNPYNYNPPSQGSFGGYPQAPQPPQYGTGIQQPQWGAPQAPAAPSAPAAPAAPQTPAAPQAPAEPAGAMYEEPYAEPEAPNNDDKPQTPNGPSYPQY